MSRIELAFSDLRTLAQGVRTPDVEITDVTAESGGVCVELRLLSRGWKERLACVETVKVHMLLERTDRDTLCARIASAYFVNPADSGFLTRTLRAAAGKLVNVRSVLIAKLQAATGSGIAVDASEHCVHINVKELLQRWMKNATVELKAVSVSAASITVEFDVV